MGEKRNPTSDPRTGGVRNVVDRGSEDMEEQSAAVRFEGTCEAMGRTWLTEPYTRLCGPQCKLEKETPLGQALQGCHCLL